MTSNHASSPMWQRPLVATTPDDQIVPTIHAALAEKQVLPSIHFVDAGYTDTTLLLHSQQQYGIDLYGPVAADPSWQARQQTGYDHTAFQLDWETKTATCPQGIQSTQWHQKHDIGGIDCIDIRFPVAVCRHSPSRTQCTKAITAPHHLKLRSQPLYLVMQAARDRQASPTFKALYAHRAGIESTMAQGIRRSYLQHARYRGLARVAFQQIVTAVALNLIRISAWWAGVPIGLTRVSALQSLRVGISLA
ncbi:transposase [Herpetosiphon geysericola]|uniref:transposase n=1 Tax=Herpetosiphon geysericola TaxID=70996 RepID=UPI0006C917DD|nr:transposase [Herpetosiphon geysericola]